jgi:hypothetical protein
MVIGGKNQLFMEMSLTVRVLYHTVESKNDGFFLVRMFLRRAQSLGEHPEARLMAATPKSLHGLATPNTHSTGGRRYA